MRWLSFVLALTLALPSHISDAARAKTALPPENAVYRLDTGDGYCSGIAITPTRLLTARHCMPGVGETDGPMSIPVSTASVTAEDPLGRLYLLHWVSYDITDTALLELVPGQPLFPFTLLRSSRKPQFLDRIEVIGYGCDSLGKLLTARAARPGLFGISIGADWEHKVGILAHVCPGDSGGALVDADGDLLGVVVQRADDHRSAAIMLPGIEVGSPPPGIK